MKAIIELVNRNDPCRRALDIARRLDAGEADYHFGFEDAGQLFSEFTPERCRLLDALKPTGAQTIYGGTIRDRAWLLRDSTEGEVQKLWSVHYYVWLNLQTAYALRKAKQLSLATIKRDVLPREAA